MKEKYYLHLNDYYKSIFKERTLKIAIDAGFTCPNRDGNKSTLGCAFCSLRGSGDRLVKTSIKEQIDSYFSSFKAKKANKFILYFQNFTNTYASITRLKEVYDHVYIDSRIVGLDIATRADAIDEEKVKLIASYKEKYYVQVELGLQTSNESTREALNQKITNEEFLRAIDLLNKYEINTVIHIMVGLPNENHKDIVNTINFLNSINYSGLKIHSTFIEKDTKLYELYINNKYKPIEYDEYMYELGYIISHIKKDIVIHRITGDPYLPNFVAPSWMIHKKKVINHIDEYLKENDLYEGKYYNI